MAGDILFLPQQRYRQEQVLRDCSYAIDLAVILLYECQRLGHRGGCKVIDFYDARSRRPADLVSANNDEIPTIRYRTSALVAEHSSSCAVNDYSSPFHRFTPRSTP